MMDEKAGYSTGAAESPEAPAYENRRASQMVEEKGMRIGEAADTFGDLNTAEKYGYVSRGLKSRHIQFIALGGTIGTGLFLGVGLSLTNAGPLSILLGYSITGIAVFAMMQSLGEMATWLPLPGAIPQFCTRYVDGAMGFAVGWNNWYSCALTQCAEISAASLVINYWPGAQSINSAAWITLIIVLIICLNVFAVAIYGEAEFIFASVKIITIIGLLLMTFVIDLGGGPDHFRRGFYYWQNPGAMNIYYLEPSDPRKDLGRFLGFFSTLVNAAFSYSGVEMVAVAAGEAENPRKNIPKAVRRVFWRILFFYCLGTLAIGVLVPYNDPKLLKAQADGSAGGNQSPWVIGIRNAGIPVLDSIINVVILTSASSSANAFLYTGSRYLYALAQNKQAPRILLRCSKAGVPYVCVLFTAAFSLLTYMAVSAGAGLVFEWFLNLTTIATLFTWVSICIAYLQFYKALIAQGVDRNTLVFKSPLQPYTCIFALAYFIMIIVFNGFASFGPTKFSITDFATAYVGIPIYFLLYAFWKVFKRTKWINPAEADIYSGKHALDAADAHWPEQIPRNMLEKFWFWLA